MLVIGSKAVSIFDRASKDIDLIATFDELNQLTRELREKGKIASIPLSKNKTVLFLPNWSPPIEVEIAWPGSTGAELLERVAKDTSRDLFWGRGNAPSLRKSWIATVDVLYTLKMSHRYLKNSAHFKKTMDDIRVLRNHGAKIFDEGWLKRREKETYTYEHPKLNVNKADFFKDDGIKYVYDHDSIHQAMAHLRKLDNPGTVLVPAYKFYAGDGEVLSSKEKFSAQTEQVRLFGVLEEAYVLAIERSQIPYGTSPNRTIPRKPVQGDPPCQHRSFVIALEKVCTSITSGWFREYAWEHYEEVYAMYDPNYVWRFWEAVKTGIVKPHKEGK